MPFDCGNVVTYERALVLAGLGFGTALIVALFFWQIPIRTFHESNFPGPSRLKIVLNTPVALLSESCMPNVPQIVLPISCLSWCVVTD